jgi:hypothetical protein
MFREVKIMPSPSITRDAILDLIAREGPMTAAEITETLGRTRQSVTGSIVIMRKYGAQYLRISSYRRQRGRQGSEAPVYALGPGKDAKRPDIRTNEEDRKRQARYRDKNRALIRLRQQKRRRGSVNPFLQLVQQVAK